MKKNIFLYYPIYDFVIQDIMEKLDGLSDEEVTLRVNCPGGDVFSAIGMYARLKELGNVNTKIDGAAMSAAAFIPFYSKTAECLDITKFLFHRADMWVTNEDDQEFLDNVNNDLKAQMKKVIDSKKWKEITGHTIEELFDPKQRLEITINGNEAKKLGIVDKVTKLTPEREKEIAAYTHKFFKIAAEAESPSKPTTMTKEELKAKFPELFAQIVAIGVTRERNRVSAFVPFITVDPKGVKAAIEGKEKITESQRSEFALKAYSGKRSEDMKDENAEDVKTEASKEDGKAKTEAEKKKSLEMEAFEKSVDARLGKK